MVLETKKILRLCFDSLFFLRPHSEMPSAQATLCTRVRAGGASSPSGLLLATPCCLRSGDPVSASLSNPRSFSPCWAPALLAALPPAHSLFLCPSPHTVSSDQCPGAQQNHNRCSLSSLQALQSMDIMLEVMVLNSAGSKGCEMLQDILEVCTVHRVGRWKEPPPGVPHSGGEGAQGCVQSCPGSCQRRTLPAGLA